MFSFSYILTLELYVYFFPIILLEKRYLLLIILYIIHLIPVHIFQHVLYNIVYNYQAIPKHLSKNIPENRKGSMLDTIVNNSNYFPFFHLKYYFLYSMTATIFHQFYFSILFLYFLYWTICVHFFQLFLIQNYFLDLYQ